MRGPPRLLRFPSHYTSYMNCNYECLMLNVRARTLVGVKRIAQYLPQLPSFSQNFQMSDVGTGSAIVFIKLAVPRVVPRRLWALKTICLSAKPGNRSTLGLHRLRRKSDHSRQSVQDRL